MVFDATAAAPSYAVRRPLVRLDAWTIGALLAALLAAAPIFAIFWIAATPAEAIWSHLVDTVLASYVGTTLGLMLGVGVGTFLLGVGSAWIVSSLEFPGRRLFEWALLLPLAMPAYVIAFVYTDLLEFAGPVQGALRELFGWTRPADYWFPEIRSLGGAIVMMTLVLYPYVYLLSRAAFLEQSAGVFEVSRTLGRGPWRSFFTVAVPLARPAIVIGLSLVMMETLNDFGTVDFFAVGTLTLGVFDVWRNMNNVGGAAQLALVMLGFVVLLLALERFARRRQRFHHTGRRTKRPARIGLRSWQKMMAIGACLVPLILGFLLPAAVLLILALPERRNLAETGFFGAALNSLTVSSLAAVLAVAVGLFLAYGLRLSRNSVLKVITRIAGSGYAIPGTVLAIGVIMPLAAFDNALDGVLRRTLGVSTGLLLSGTIAALTFGYVVRFLALSLGALETSLARITPSIDAAARTLGAGPGRTLVRIHLPLIRKSLLTAAILVFVDGMKELPMTIVMRPFGFETLATQVNQFASAEQFGQAAPAALAIMAAGILPVIVLSLAITREFAGEKETIEGAL